MSLSLYVNTIQIVLGADPADEFSWSRIYGSLCCLRQSLLCSTCRKLLTVPQRPQYSNCQHNYCRRCTGGRKPQCGYCKDNPKFVENVRLRIILQCYKKMCRYIISSAICRCWNKTKLTSPMVRFISMVYEGAGLRDRYHYSSNSTNGSLKKKLKSSLKSNSENENSQPVNGQKTVYTVKLNENLINTKSPKVLIKKTSIADAMFADFSAPDPSSDDSEIDCPKVIAECMRSVKEKRNCRCGMAAPNPGKLTCCGQRCPCYVNGRACINCRCRGCRNPQKNLISSPPYCGHHSDHKIPDETYVVIGYDSSDEASCTNSERDPSE